MHPMTIIELFNSSALVFIAAAWLVSKDAKRLIVLILANYAIWYGMEFSLTHYDGKVFTFSVGNSYYLLQAAREVVILAFLLDAWMQNKASAFWCKAYLSVLAISASCNVIMAADASTEVGYAIAGKGGFRAFHYYVNQAIPFAEILIAWGSSNNVISRFFKRSFTSPVENALPNDSSGKAD